jgi:thermitase
MRGRCPFLVALAAAAALAGPAEAEAHPDAAPGELIVRFAEGADAGEREELRDRAGVEGGTRLPLSGLQVVEVEPGQTDVAAERALERSDAVVYAEPNYYRGAFRRPNDSYFRFQWALENTGQSGGLAGADIDALAAWDATIGGPETVVAVVDTGVLITHADLAGAGWSNPGESGAGRETNGVDDDRNGLVDDWRGWDWVARDGDPADENGHGTHVAGTVAARGDDRRGIAGVSWRARLMPLRVLGADGSGTVADAVRAYRYAAAAGARIVNASLGSPASSRAEQDAIAAAGGTLFVVAAGNGGEDQVGDDNDSLPQYPCAYPLANVVCVAATDRSDRLASFSNYGDGSVDLAAPGVSILSTWNDGGYSFANGTSMATPHVSGAAALLAAAQPSLTAGDIRAALLDGVDALPSLTGRVATGGRLNAERALRIAAPGIAGSPVAAPMPGPEPAPAPTQGPPTPAPPTAPPIADRRAPLVTLRVRPRQPLPRVVARGLRARVACSEPCTVRLRALLGARTAQRARSARERLARSTRAVVLGYAHVRVRDARRVTVRLSRRARVRLRRLGPVRIVLEATATDGAGNARAARARAVLSR